MDAHLKRSGKFHDTVMTQGEKIIVVPYSPIFADDDEELKRKLREIDNLNEIDIRRKIIDDRNKMHIPKIVKSDIRRQYGVMFANVYNSLDCEMMKSFTSSYFDSSRFVYFQRDQHIMQGTKHKQFHINSLETFHDFWYLHMHDTPDVVFRLGKMLYKLRSDQSGLIYFQCSITGQRNFSLETSNECKFMELFQRNHIQLEQLDLMVNSDNKYSDLVSLRPLLSNEEGCSENNFFNPFRERLQIPERGIWEMIESFQRSIQSVDLLNSKAIITSLVYPYAIQGIFALHFDAQARIFKLTFQLVDFAPRLFGNFGS